MTAAMTHEVKRPAAVLAEDVICQSFIQSSSTLAYACLLIRRGRHDLAAHVLHSLESKPASRFKDMVFYLQAQIGIETGDFAAVKRRLVPRATQHPNDMVALSLLASCVHLEWEDWQHRNPAAAARTMAEERAAAPVAPEPEPGVPVYHTLSVPTVSSAPAGFPGASIPDLSSMAPAVSDLQASQDRASGPSPYAPPAADVHVTAPIPALAASAIPPVSAPAAPAPPAPASPDITPLNLNAVVPPSPEMPYSVGDQDFGIFQTLASDPNTLALSLWNSGQRKLKTTSRRSDAEALVSTLPQVLPFGLAEAVRALDGGELMKACFAFQNLTVTSLHAGPENLGLVTGGLNQSLLTMVRAENIFLKAARPAAGIQGAAAASRVGAGAP